MVFGERGSRKPLSTCNDGGRSAAARYAHLCANIAGRQAIIATRSPVIDGHLTKVSLAGILLRGMGVSSTAARDAVRGGPFFRIGNGGGLALRCGFSAQCSMQARPGAGRHGASVVAVMSAPWVVVGAIDRFRRAIALISVVGGIVHSGIHCSMPLWYSRTLG